MGNKEDIEKNIEINDENVDKNVVSEENTENASAKADNCLLYTSPSPRD